MVGEGGQKIMEHQVEVEGNPGEAAVPTKAKPEGEGVRIVVVRVVLVSLAVTPMITALSKLPSYLPNREVMFFLYLNC